MGGTSYGLEPSSTQARVAIDGCTITYTNLTETRHRVYVAYGPAQRPAGPWAMVDPGGAATFTAPGPTTASLVIDGKVHTDYTC